MPTVTANRALWFIDNLVRVLVDGETTAGALDLVEVEAREGDMPPLHVHHDTDETFYVLEGEVSLHLPGGSVTLGAGESFFAPRGVPHVYRVESERARMLAVGTPAGFADFVREVSDGPEGDGFPPRGREHDPARLAEVAARHRIQLLGPPGLMP
jgi:mannose-6-phosphate isomerase-like protein (cupin superfamily)